MEIISQNSYKGIGKYNNDIYNNIGSMHYVIDGATALFNDNLFFKTSDLYEYVQLLKKNIKNEDTLINNLKKGIVNTNKEIQNINNYEEYILPTFTVAAIKEHNNFIEIFLLCDCLISVLYKDGTIENIEDLRFYNFKNQYKGLNNSDDMQLSLKEKIKLKMPMWKEIRKFANREDGYPVGSTKESSIDKGITKKIDNSKVDKILLCTDGFYKELGVPNDMDYFDKEKLEKKIKVSQDDLTYILLKI